MDNFVVKDGNVEPAYNGVNQPTYKNHEGDAIPDHAVNQSAEASTDKPLTGDQILDSAVVASNALIKAKEKSDAINGDKPLYGLPPESDTTNRRRQQNQ